MNRRIRVLVVVLALAVPITLAAEGQDTQRLPRVGFIGATGPSFDPLFYGAVQQAFHEAGWIDGKTMVWYPRGAGGESERVPTLVAELERLNVDLLVTSTTGVTQHAVTATTTTPIVFMMVSDPVAAGTVSSLAGSGRNVTGVSMQNPELSAKRVQFLKEMVPGLTRVGVLVDQTRPFQAALLNRTAAAARSLGLAISTFEVRSPEDLEGTFSSMRTANCEAFLPLSSPNFWVQRNHIVELAATHHLPAIYESIVFVRAGGLAAYGENWKEHLRRAVRHAGRVLRGAKPGELAVEQPTTFEFVINVKTAKALGLTIPESVLVRADEVIE